VIDESAIRQGYEALAPVLDERALRRFAAAEAVTAGRAWTFGIARRGRRRGARARRPGAGRKPLCETDASLLDDLRSPVDPTARGDPQSPLSWTSKSLPKLSEALRSMGHTVVGELLRRLDDRLQANRKTREGTRATVTVVDRDAQYNYIDAP
jgi:hypothetical protein